MMSKQHFRGFVHTPKQEASTYTSSRTCFFYFPSLQAISFASHFKEYFLPTPPFYCQQKVLPATSRDQGIVAHPQVVQIERWRTEGSSADGWVDGSCRRWRREGLMGKKGWRRSGEGRKVSRGFVPCVHTHWVASVTIGRKRNLAMCTIRSFLSFFDASWQQERVHCLI
ncbi:uncharacterized protein LOC119302245 isoform X1 [Triticum dicoccoides]|uniref:uncharacterized protein LOC119302245 isoform X1 n=1 Tax=Triticum dicoccoides TaxID=85692 RepID=UPI000E7986A5|nr:uncharacterized protein LOC119302245 isoform X1 [Triticum dicoccoides]